MVTKNRLGARCTTDDSNPTFKVSFKSYNSLDFKTTTKMTNGFNWRNSNALEGFNIKLKQRC